MWLFQNISLDYSVNNVERFSALKKKVNLTTGGEMLDSNRVVFGMSLPNLLPKPSNIVS